MTARWVLRLQSQLPKASILCHSLSQIVVVGRPTFECRRRDLIYTQQRHVGSRAWQNPGLRRCLAVGPWSTNIVSKRRAPGKRHRQSPYLISARDSVITEARKTCSDHTVVYGARFQSSSDDELPQRNCMRKGTGGHGRDVYQNLGWNDNTNCPPAPKFSHIYCDTLDRALETGCDAPPIPKGRYPILCFYFMTSSYNSQFHTFSTLAACSIKFLS